MKKITLHVDLLLAGLLTFLLSGTVFAQGTTIDLATYRFLEKARHIGDYMNKGDFAAIEREFDSTLQKQLPYSKLKPLMENLIQGAFSVDVLEDRAAVPLEPGFAFDARRHRHRLSLYLAVERPAPCTHNQYQSQ